ncbi:MAG: hypothetical protein AB7N71_11720 [Phycisphaerae bacterium]
MNIDVHCHYTLSRCRLVDAPRFSFETLDDIEDKDSPLLPADTRPTAFDACVAPAAENRVAFRVMRRLLGIDASIAAGDALDAALAESWLQHLRTEGPIDKYVLLAFDAYHDDDGAIAPLPQQYRARGSDMYASNTLIRAVCAAEGLISRGDGGFRFAQPTLQEDLQKKRTGEMPDPHVIPNSHARQARFLFGASVHPYRAQAIENISEVFDGGAVLLKWLPVHQNIAARDPRTIAALRHCAAIGLPILVHYNEEFTLSSNCPKHLSPIPMLEVLEQLRREGDMPTVILAHVATPVLSRSRRRWYEIVCGALQYSFADAPLYADISALCSLTKTGYLKELARRQDLHHKLLFGSDFPVPPACWRLWHRLGSQYKTVAAVESWPQRSAECCRALGFHEIVFAQAAGLLANVSK